MGGFCEKMPEAFSVSDRASKNGLSVGSKMDLLLVKPSAMMAVPPG